MKLEEDDIILLLEMTNSEYEAIEGALEYIKDPDITSELKIAATKVAILHDKVLREANLDADSCHVRLDHSFCSICGSSFN